LQNDLKGGYGTRTAEGMHYKNSPIIEALCEFRLSPDTPWDLTVPGLIFPKVSHFLPIKEQRVQQGLEVKQQKDGVHHEVNVDQRIFFLSEDKKTFMQVGLHVMGFNRLKPYPGWEDFRAGLHQAYEALLQTVDVKGFQRIGVRYVNRIELQNRHVDLEQFFDFRPYIAEGLPQEISGFIVGCRFPFNSMRDALKVQLTNAVPEKEGQRAFILDLDYSLSQPKSIEVDQALEWVEEAHSQVERSFEGSIKEPLREAFKGGDLSGGI
jgi:uncharacterized protein (TIGR04255 family)